MTNWTKVDNDAPAVLRALADGKKVRWALWGDEEWARLGRDGRLRGEDGSSYPTSNFSGVWFIEAPRNIVTDPQVGDEFVWDDKRAKVVAVADGFVFYHDGKVATGRSKKRWAECFDSGDYKRIEAGKQ